ncbi:hypothetical protein A2W48_00645 [Candidatus Giovannonibacteria bacterium RIFCSPHIGHO2_12_44_12]|uniref:Uncharacterized protein n=4 Tax=Candidatus Giovannoniibacteriota TaxID=1752738 RepID=A0A1F5X0H2_9BACT|nr:MAG: hypothetical protein A2W57_00270 [Candidatus Giovannonibacteria bacterium RIFCSPHIGHO2_02_43_16]OGF81397.1 MAG: hypothetical protein A2W48_00645 [Candidatus Giovannonibacteria bacterium RIFCSPHIGHO2_12_44_12]OGF85495.1 MAG: hypothetical protein A2Z63_03160 [Candidatus Giovannonibacteria bacterium RIFCSPLOWO2_02_44_8]OGF94006.1 MAG: hypothetical protein A2Y47_01370 [Candidatus Giovannonibacteria bacterium RIFCSPLOWO2_12_43_8]
MEYFTEEGAIEKLTVTVEIDFEIDGHLVSAEGVVTDYFRIADLGFSVLIQCLIAGGKSVSVLFNKTKYEDCVEELSDPIIEEHFNGKDKVLYRFLSQWPQ